MKLETLSTGDLLNYATILENIVTSNFGIQREMSEAVSGGFCTQKEIQTIFDKSTDTCQEADLTYEKIQKELDLRAKKDLGLKFGIRRTQSIIKELEAFANMRNQELQEKEKKMADDAKKISEETVAKMELIKDDNTE